MFDPYRWVADPWWISALLIFAGWYLWVAQVHGAAIWRRACHLAGLGLIAAGLLSPIEHVALNSMLSFHLLQNVMLADWAPPLLVLGAAPALAVAAERRGWVRAATHPVVALPYWLGAWYVLHLPPVYDYALRHHWALGVEHLVFITAGLAFWWPVLQPGRMRAAPKLVYLFGAFFLAAPVALFIALSSTPLYPFYDHTPHLWGWSPLADQQAGGMAMAVEQSVLLFAAFSWTFLQMLAEDERAPEVATIP
ncbi:MAG: cytochrome c oxidase assembly protein [Gaiellales bacterium]